MHNAQEMFDFIVTVLAVGGILSISLIGVGLYKLYHSIKNGTFTEDDQ